MSAPVYIIHPSMVEAMKSEFGGVLPSGVVVMATIPPFRRDGMRQHPAARPHKSFQPRSKSK